MKILSQFANEVLVWRGRISEKMDNIKEENAEIVGYYSYRRTIHNTNGMMTKVSIFSKKGGKTNFHGYS